MPGAAQDGRQSWSSQREAADRAHRRRAARRGRRRWPSGPARPGVGRGDRVAGYLPNIPEAVDRLAGDRRASARSGRRARRSSAPAASSIGSARSSRRCSSPSTATATATGSSTVAAELAEIRGGAAVAGATVVVADYLDARRAAPAPRTRSRWARAARRRASPAFEHVPFDHPLWILYSLRHHRAAEADRARPRRHPARAPQGARLAPRSRPRRPVLLVLRTTGWMMWNYLVSGLLVGATIVLYDGNPRLSRPRRALAPGRRDDGRLLRASVAPYLMACREGRRSSRRERRPRRAARVGSTGVAAARRAGFALGARQRSAPTVLLDSICGGTDVCTAFLGGVAAAAGARGRDLPAGARARGRGVRRRRGAGRSGEVGELVITAPDAVDAGRVLERSRRQPPTATRTSRPIPGVWRHGDWITITDRGRAVSPAARDATLNRGGVRIGTAEFYGVVEALPEIADSLVVHLEDDGGGPGELLLFVVPRPGVALDDELPRAHRARACATTCRPGTFPTRRSPCNRSRARCPARSSRFP